MNFGRKVLLLIFGDKKNNKKQLLFWVPTIVPQAIFTTGKILKSDIKFFRTYKLSKEIIYLDWL